MIKMKRTPKVIKQQTEEQLDERWMIANMKDARNDDYAEMRPKHCPECGTKLIY